VIILSQWDGLTVKEFLPDRNLSVDVLHNHNDNFAKYKTGWEMLLKERNYLKLVIA
jgi:hypothetical protein